MSDQSFVCATCGETHPGLPTDYGFRLPDEIHSLSYLERYLRSRSNSDLSTLDDSRYYIRGVIPLPFTESEGEFCWGVWVEVSKEHHDTYVQGFDEDLSGHERFVGKIANDIPDYGGTMDLPVEVQFQAEGSRPSFYFSVDTIHALAHEQRGGITSRRHHDLLQTVGFFKNKDA